MPAAVVALLVGFVGVGIAYRQYRVARAKLNLDLFEKRYELFTLVWEFASSVTTKGPPPLLAPERAAVTNLLPKIEFLFGANIAQYVRDLNANAATLWAIKQATEANNDVMRPEHIYRHLELMKWFADEAMVGIRKQFGVYLKFEQWH
ncbi:hypothetical protein [Burkholderia orbicola]|uniref:hypothetical protein n=1 Tax=Burkholderia orbicola TaxID=2978683 RepID=UPI0039A61CC9